jgi:hypothetical protein
MRIALIVLIAAGLIYAIAAGLGLTHSKKKGLAKKVTILNDFEDADNDLDWFTGGYAKVEQSNQNQTHGKHSAKVTFYVPTQFYATPTPTATWQPEIVLDTRSVTKLPVFEWQDYTSLKLDAFNPEDQPVTYHIKLTDAKSFKYETNGVLLSKKVTNISVSLDDLSQARMDLSAMRSIEFWVDMTGADKPRSVYLDNLRLEFDPGEVKKK